MLTRYYSFGLKHKGYNNNILSEFNYKTYQGQEFTADLDLNVHEWKYRISDPAIGRFWQVDPLAEHYSYNSTYAFAENKLGIGRELEGLEVVPATPPYGKGMTSVNLVRHQEANRVANTVAAVGQLAMVAPVVVANVGVRASATFVVNGVKDEIASRLTNGVSDYASLFKGARNLFKKGLRWFSKRGAKNADNGVGDVVGNVADAKDLASRKNRIGNLTDAADRRKISDLEADGLAIFEKSLGKGKLSASSHAGTDAMLGNKSVSHFGTGPIGRTFDDESFGKWMTGTFKKHIGQSHDYHVIDMRNFTSSQQSTVMSKINDLIGNNEVSGSVHVIMN